VARKATLPEAQFLRAVFADELSEEALAVRWRADAETVLKRLRQQINTALDTLSYRERAILEMRYGLGDGYAYTLAEAGQVFRLTRERIRQLQARAVNKLRRRAGALRNFVLGK